MWSDFVNLWSCWLVWANIWERHSVISDQNDHWSVLAKVMASSTLNVKGWIQRLVSSEINWKWSEMVWVEKSGAEEKWECLAAFDFSQCVFSEENFKGLSEMVQEEKCDSGESENVWSCLDFSPMCVFKRKFQRFVWGFVKNYQNCKKISQLSKIIFLF